MEKRKKTKGRDTKVIRAMVDIKLGRILRKAENTTQSALPERAFPEMGIRQLLDAKSGICTYLLWDKETEVAILINPVDTESSRDMLLTTSLRVVYAVNSHGLDKDHHISVGTRELKEKITGIKVILTKTTDVDADADILLEKDDILVEDGDEIHFGNRFITVIATPSPQTPGNVAFLLDDKKAILTSSPLLRHENGRCDVAATEVLHLYALPNETIVFPGYCYDSADRIEPRSSTIGQEKRANSLLLA